MIFDRAPNPLRNAGAAIVALDRMIIGIIALVLPRFSPCNRTRVGRNRFSLDRLESTGRHARQRLASIPAYSSPSPRLGSWLGRLLLFIYCGTADKKSLLSGSPAELIFVGLCMVSGIARIAPFFSLADAARFLNGRLGTNGQVLFEGSPGVASSLGFYLERKFAMVNQEPDPRIPLTPEQRDLFLNEKAALEHWRAPRAVFLIIEEDRVAYWRELLTQKFPCLSSGRELRHLHYSFESTLAVV